MSCDERGIQDSGKKKRSDNRVRERDCKARQEPHNCNDMPELDLIDCFGTRMDGESCVRWFWLDNDMECPQEGPFQLPHEAKHFGKNTRKHIVLRRLNIGTAWM